MSTEDLAIRLRLSGARSAIADANATKRALAGVGREAGESGKRAREASGHFKLMSGAMGAMRSAAGIAGFAGLAIGLRDAVTAGVKLQSQQALLQQSLRASGVHGTAAFEQINKAAERLAGRGGFAVPEQLQAMTQFVRITGSATKAVQLNTAATALARGAHIDFARAQMMLQRVIATGTVGRFAPYIGMLSATKDHVQALTAAHKLDVLQLEAQAKAMGKAGPMWLKQQMLIHGVSAAALDHAKTLDKQATAQTVLERVQQRYGGATVAYSHTAAGALSNLKNTLESVMARLGVMLLPIITKLAKGLEHVVMVVQAHWPQIKAIAKRVFDPVVAVVKDVVHWFGKHRDVAIALAATVGTLVVVFEAFRAALAIQAAINGVTAAITALDLSMTAMPLVAVVAGIAALTGALVYAYLHCKSFRDIVQSVFSSIKQIITATVNFLAPLFKIFIQGFVTQVQGLIGIFRGVWDIIRGIFTLNAGLAWKGVENIFGGAVKVVGGIVMTMVAPFRMAFAGIKAVAAPVINWLRDAIKWIIDKVLWLPREIAKLNPFGGGPSAGALSHAAAQRGFGTGRPGNLGAIGRAGGGPVSGFGAGDSVPALLTPGEFVVQRQIVSQVGMPAMQHFNATGQMAGGPLVLEQSVPIILRTTDRQLAEGVLRYTLKRAAHGSATLAGGSLTTR